MNRHGETRVATQSLWKPMASNAGCISGLDMKAFPDQSSAVIFDHHHNRRLV
jgi:hypothetical protein